MSNYLDPEKKTIRKKEIGHLFNIHDAVTPLTTLLVSEIKMAACPDTVNKGFRCLARLSFSGKSP